ncbi:hypothetical protein EDB83DRAFT_2676554 [Lactarius deliciosus]|nr:hypothetical protein EDB83DRAFT_2676554 [Lactarius deliciosus]
MVMRFKSPICRISISPNGQFIAADGLKSIEKRDILIGSSAVSIDLPRPLFYVSTYIDEVDVMHRLKKLVQRPAMTIERGTVESRVAEALRYAEDVASLTPVSGLKNVLHSLLTLFHAGYNSDSQPRLRSTELHVKSLTEVVLMQIKEKELSDIPHQVLNDLEELIRTIETITATCRQDLSQGRLERFAIGTEGAEEHLKWKVSNAYLRISNTIKQFMERETTHLLEDVERRIEPIVSKNPYLSAHAQRAECLEGTRTVVLDEIFAWLEDPSSARIFWLSGSAGSGKSTVAQSASIRAPLLGDHLVVSVFFSQFGYAGLCDPSSVFQTLAFQFGLLDIGYKEHISEVISEHPDLFEKHLRFQYEKLIIEPLDAIRRPHSRILIILDGLDECEPRGATAVLKVLLAEDVAQPKELKILTASRPEAYLRKIFDDRRDSDIRKLSLEDVETASDIQHYFRISLEQLPTHLVNTFTVSEGMITELAKRAGNSFIYAATIVRFIFDKHSQNPQKLIDFLLSSRTDPEEHPHARLDALFLGILQQALPLGASDDEKCRCRTVLGLLACFREPFPMKEMERFFGLKRRDVMSALRRLQSLIQVPESNLLEFDHVAPRIRHRSFTDFIADPARCLDRNFVVDIDSTEKRIFNKCSSLYNLWRQKVVDDLGRNSPRKDDGVMTTGTSPDFSAQEQYACLYWVSHLTNIKDVDESAQYHLDDRCLLRWIETMALLGMLREAVMHLDQVRTWITSVKGETDSAPDRLVDLMDNAFHLLLHHATTISYDSLLIYDSALFTTAIGFHLQVERSHTYSLGRVSYSRHFRAHSELASIQEPIFKLCYDFALALAWSPNSQHIALSRANGIEIQDALSGHIVDSFGLSPALETKLEHVLYPQKVSCHCLAFYPDNSRIAYVTRDGKVHVRNTLSKTEEFVVTGHDSEGGLVSINVSPNGKLLVSGSKSGRIQVCNAQNGALVWAVETDTKLKSTSVAPNSQLIISVSCSRNCGIRIWNANDGLPLSILPHDVISVSLSPDCNQLASIDQEGLVRVWGMSQMSIEPIQEWRIGAQPACLVFSPNGRQLAAAKSDVVYILRRDAGDVATLDGHTSRVTSLAFSANGLTLASGSLDGTIRLWDTSSIGSSRVEKDKQEEWDVIRWSPRGRAVMLSKYGDLQGELDEKREVWIWNTQDGTSRVLDDPPDGSYVAISDCGRYLGVYSWDPAYRMTTRSIASNVAQSNTFSLDVEDPIRCCYEFFPNSTRFATTFQKKIFTWDASIAHPEATTSLVGHAEEVDMLCFVPDGSLLLSIAGEEVFAWNVDTLQLVSKTGNVIPRYPSIDATKDDWVVMIPPDHGGRRLPDRRLFRSPYQLEPGPDGFWNISASWWSKCILIRFRNGNVLIVDFSALTAAVIDFTN